MAGDALAQDERPVERSPFNTLVRWGTSGVLGLAANFIMFEGLFRSLPKNDLRPTIAWFVSYCIGILIQHALHRSLVFGLDTPYWLTLRRSTAVYVVSLAIATGLNVLVVNLTSLDYRLVWLLTVGSMSLLNYLALKLYAFRR